MQLFKSAILQESGPSWLLNSFLRASQDPANLPISLPSPRVKNLPVIPQYKEISYGWENKLDIAYSDDRILGKYDQSSPAVVRFLHQGQIDIGQLCLKELDF